MIKNMVRRALVRRGYKLIRADASNVLEYLMASLLKRNGKLSFIQIGANDGVMADPLYPFVTHHHARVRGVVIEPVKDYFNDLTRNYRGYPNITPVNVAVHRTERVMTIYRVSSAAKGLPQWTKGIATFDKHRHQNPKKSPVEHMAPEQVNCMPLSELFATHGVPDVLQIDTEGYDEEIIASIDLNNAPRIIRFEYTAMTLEGLNRTLVRFNSHGYQVVVEPLDATAYIPDVVIADRVKAKREA